MGEEGVPGEEPWIFKGIGVGREQVVVFDVGLGGGRPVEEGGGLQASF